MNKKRGFLFLLFMLGLRQAIFKEKQKSYWIEDYTKLKLRKIVSSFDFSDVHQKTKFIVALLCDKKATLYETKTSLIVFNN